MTRPLGDKQRDLLRVMAGGWALLTPTKTSRSLERRGLVVDDGGPIVITAAGYRALADEMDAGRLVMAPQRKGGADVR